MTPPDEQLFDWRRGGAAAIALLATLVLLAMVTLVAITNSARDEALTDERHAYDVTLLTRTMDGSIARAEAALGRYALDEDPNSSGSRYYAQWRLAEQQMTQLERSVTTDADQQRRVAELRRLFDERGKQFSDVARYVRAKQKAYGVNYYYSISLPPNDEEKDVGTRLRGKLNEIADAERAALSSKIEESQFFSAEADRLTDYLSWLGVVVGLFAIFMGFYLTGLVIIIDGGMVLI